MLPVNIGAAYGVPRNEYGAISLLLSLASISLSLPYFLPPFPIPVSPFTSLTVT